MSVRYTDQVAAEDLATVCTALATCDRDREVARARVVEAMARVADEFGLIAAATELGRSLEEFGSADDARAFVGALS